MADLKVRTTAVVVRTFRFARDHGRIIRRLPFLELRSAMPTRRFAGFTLAVGFATLLLGWSTSRVVSTAPRAASAPASWTNDLSPIAADDWNYDRAAHLLERVGFGGTPEE